MKRVAIRLDAGISIGLGHLMRCMSLAERLQEEYRIEVIFICRNKLHMEVGFEVVYLDMEYVTDERKYYFPSICDELENMKRILCKRNIDCLIVDHYGADDNYFKEIRNYVAFLMCIDDGVWRHIPVDVVINGNIYGVEADYGSVPVQLLGGEYTLLRSDFMDIPNRVLREKVKFVYITSGGIDPLHFCESIIKAVIMNMNDMEFHVIVGADFDSGYITELEKYKVVLHKNADMKRCMMDADLFISSAGSTLYELAVTGTPSISYILADDQIRVAEGMWKEKCSIEGGAFSEFKPQRLTELLQRTYDFHLRQEICEKAQKTICRYGAANVARKIAIVLFADNKEGIK